MNLLNVLLMAPQGGNAGSGMGSTIIFMVLLFVVFYFFFIRPQVRRQKEQQKYRESLQKGQRIITIGGIHGKIVEMQEKTCTIEVEGGVKFRVEKSAIATNATDQLTSESK